jgi:hypothetical protein
MIFNSGSTRSSPRSILALQRGTGKGLAAASDSGFADNYLDRKSSQGFAIMLFGGLIARRAK